MKESQKRKFKLYENLVDTGVKGSMLAIFITGVPALLSLVTPIPKTIAFGAYGLSNLAFIGTFMCGVKLEDVKQKYKIANTELSRNK